MSLIISIITIIHQICGCSRNIWVPPLSNMKWSGNIIRSMNHSRIRVRIAAKLYELLSPIQQGSYTEGNNYSYQDRFPKHKSMHSQAQAAQSKKMPPDETKCLFALTPYYHKSSHSLFPHFYNKHNTNYIKNNLIKTTAAINLLRQLKLWFDSLTSNIMEKIS